MSAHLLYFDVCTSNLMVDANDRSKGILVDFDDCVRESEANDARGYSAVGTHCMAINLLRDPPPRRTYEHTLQSFFWAFWDIILNYLNGIRILPSPNEKWHEGTLESMRGAKALFIDVIDEDVETQRQKDAEKFCAGLGADSVAFAKFMLAWTNNEAIGYQQRSHGWNVLTLQHELKLVIGKT